MRLYALTGVALAAFAFAGLDSTARSEESTAISGGAAAPRSAYAAFGMRGGGFRGGGFRGHSFGRHGFFGRRFRGPGFASGRFFGREFKGPGFAGSRFFGRHRFGGWGGGGPFYLSGSYTPAALTLQQYIVIGGSASPYYAPSVTQLPQSPGIRESRPAQAVLYVINDRSASQRGGIVSAVRSSRATTTRLPDGEEGAEQGRGEVELGAKIVHLNVPVGRR